ncbi:hypothetical protein AALP_AA2G000700 [Arabis alpina]|uniref:Uncharacterized protein n=1 Tax=Arabis alpina TaxID=50452 RepID=A0A087HEC4_ARAAL|nr:hypothetical protein AALP_AA2G000700 [Arabis alpina]
MNFHEKGDRLRSRTGDGPKYEPEHTPRSYPIREHSPRSTYQAVEPRCRPQRGIVRVGPRSTVSVRVEELEANLVRLRLVTKNLDISRCKELEAQIRAKQAENQLRRAGIRLARGSLPFSPNPPQHQLQIMSVGMGETRRRTQEATVPVRNDEIQAALVRLSVTTRELEISRTNEFEFRVRAEQAENQLRAAGIRPSGGVVPRLHARR